MPIDHFLVVVARRHIDGLLRRSVQKRLQGDLPRALLLSGGLDSSSILRHAHELGEKLPCYTVALSGERVDESSLAARVAKVLEADHHILRIHDRDLVDAIDALQTRGFALQELEDEALLERAYALLEELELLRDEVVRAEPGG